METDFLLPAIEPADQELARRMRLIHKTYSGGLNGFFDRIEREDDEQEAMLNRLQESRLRRLIELSVKASHRANA